VQFFKVVLQVLIACRRRSSTRSLCPPGAKALDQREQHVLPLLHLGRLAELGQEGAVVALVQHARAVVDFKQRQ